MNQAGRHVGHVSGPRIGAAAVITVAGGGVLIDGVPASAGNFVVDTLSADAAEPSGTSLAEAVAAANGDPDLSTITFESGLVGTIDTINVPRITEDLVIDGPGRAVITLTNSDGDALYVYNDADLTLSGLTITDPSTAGPTPRDGIRASAGGDLTVDDVVIEGAGIGVRLADADGSRPTAPDLALTDVLVRDTTERAVLAYDVGDVTLSDATIARTDGLEISGASAASLDDVEVNDSDFTAIGLYDVTAVTLDDVSISDVREADTDGVGLRAFSVSSADIDELDVSGATYAGAMFYLVGDLDADDVTLTGNAIGLDLSGNTTGSLEDVTVTGNDVGVTVRRTGDVTLRDALISGNGDAATGGGGVLLAGSDVTADLTIEASTISENVSSSRAGGVSVYGTDTQLIITDTTIAGNDGPVDALAADRDGRGATVEIRRSTISGHAGDGPVVDLVDTDLNLTNSTISGNESADSIVAASDGALVGLVHSTISGNTVTGAGNGVLRQVAGGALFSVDHTILSSNTADVLLSTDGVVVANSTFDFSVLPTGGPVGGTGNIVTDDPGLGELTDHGGPTQVKLPLEGSAAIDAGNAAIASPPPTDQRGFDRVLGRIDIGAVEIQSTPFVTGVVPARLLDTREGEVTVDGLFEELGRLPDGRTTVLRVAGRGGVPADAKAAVVNITAVQPGDVGFITSHPCLLNPPLASSLNYRGGLNAGNEIIAELDENGEICLFNRSATDLVVDVVGFVPSTSRFDPVGPARLADTRELGDTIDGRFEKTGRLGAGETLELDVAGRGGVRSSADAVVVNVTAVRLDDRGFVTVHPCLPTLPLAASLNYRPGTNRGNELIAGLDDQGRLCLYTEQPADLVVDVVGQLDHETEYEPVSPARLVETRLDEFTVDGLQQQIGTRVAGQVTTVLVAGRANVPSDAIGAVVNLTAIRPEDVGFFTVFDCNGAPPLAASLNFGPGDIVGNELVVDLNASGDFCVFTSVGSELTIDVVGFVPPPT